MCRQLMPTTLFNLSAQLQHPKRPFSIFPRGYSDLDILDGLVAAEVQGETVEHFTGEQPDEQQRSLQQTAGIPTGVAFDIHKQIELRRSKQRAAETENMAREAKENPT
jgi:hypothetical protein